MGALERKERCEGTTQWQWPREQLRESSGSSLCPKEGTRKERGKGTGEHQDCLIEVLSNGIYCSSYSSAFYPY